MTVAPHLSIYDSFGEEQFPSYTFARQERLLFLLAMDTAEKYHDYYENIGKYLYGFEVTKNSLSYYVRKTYSVIVCFEIFVTFKSRSFYFRLFLKALTFRVNGRSRRS